MGAGFSYQRFGVVLLVAYLVLTLEIGLYYTLVFQFSYLQAMTGLSIALAGLSAGSLAVGRGLRRAPTAVATGLLLLGLLTGAVPFFCALPIPVPLLILLLTLPFAAAGLVIASYFDAPDAPAIYAADMAGAGLGASLVAPALFHLRQENLFFALGTLALCASLVVAARLPLPRPARLARVAAAAVLVALGAGWTAVNLKLDLFNFALALPARAEFPDKIFNTDRGRGTERPLLYSRASAVQRIDVTLGRNKCNTWYDGYSTDTIQRHPGSRLDRRLLGGFIEDPEVLIVGTAATGVLKPARLLWPGAITGLELNPVIPAMMRRDDFREAGGDAYDGIPVHVIDVRNFLDGTQRRFDLITLLNTYTVRHIGDALAPDYVHTVQAVTSYLEHLTSTGALIFEERNPHDHSQAAIDALIHTILSALYRVGASTPRQHLAVYDWYAAPRAALRGNRKQLYVQIVVKREAFTERDVRFMRWFDAQWRERLSGWRPPKGEVERLRGRGEAGDPYSGIQLHYLPDRSIESHYADVIRSWRPSLRVIEDDRPFPARADSSLAQVRREAAKTLAVIALVLVACALAFRRRGGTGAPGVGFRGFGVVALAGLGYLFLQTVLVQRFQLLFGSPGQSLPAVLGGMLIASGAGGWALSRREIDSRALLAGLAAALAIAWLTSRVAPAGLAAAALPLRFALVAISVGPLAFVLGMFLPTFVRRSVAGGAREAGPVLFGTSAGAGALATPVALVVAIQFGYAAVFLLGGVCYAVALALMPARRA